MTEELYNWLKYRWQKDNHAKYNHLFYEWVKKISNSQVEGFSKQEKQRNIHNVK